MLECTPSKFLRLGFPARAVVLTFVAVLQSTDVYVSELGTLALVIQVDFPSVAARGHYQSRPHTLFRFPAASKKNPTEPSSVSTPILSSCSRPSCPPLQSSHMPGCIS